MRPIVGLSLVLALLAPAVLHAGQIYGTIVSGGQGSRAPTSPSNAAIKRQSRVRRPPTARTGST